MALNTIAKFESRSEPGTFHEVRRTLKGGVLYCTCPGWRFGPRDPQTGRKRDCRHVRHVRVHSETSRQLSLAF